MSGVHRARLPEPGEPSSDEGEGHLGQRPGHTYPLPGIPVELVVMADENVLNLKYTRSDGMGRCVALPLTNGERDMILELRQYANDDEEEQQREQRAMAPPMDAGMTEPQPTNEEGN